MPTFRIEFVCEWQPRKVEQATRMLRGWFAQMGGVQGIDRIAIVSIDTPKEEEKPKVIRLHCAAWLRKELRECGATWEAPQFTPCPACNGRSGVTKVDVESYAKFPLPAPPPPAPDTTGTTVPAA